MEDRLTARAVVKTLITMGVVVITALAAPMVLASDGQRSSDEVSRITRQVSQEIYSPYCPGQTLQMCPSSNASEARQQIQRMAAEGMDAEEIKQVLLERYGSEYELVEPPSSEQSLLLGGIVGGLVVATLAVGLLARRRLTSSDEEDVDTEFAGDFDEEQDEMLLAELRAEYDDWSEK